MTRANTHMKWRSFGSESPSGLYCTNQYISPNHPMGRSSNRRHKSESPVTEFGSRSSLNHCNTQLNTKRKRNQHTHIIHTRVPIHRCHTRIHTRVHVHTYIYTSMHTIYMHTYIQTYAYIIYTYPSTLKHTCRSISTYY